MKYLIGNWKANKNLNETRHFLQEWQNLLAQNRLSNQALVAIAPPYVLYPIFLAKLKELNLPILTAVQDISHFDAGAHTGEVVLENLADMEPSMAIVGHSERRKDNGETDALVAKKVDLLLAKQIVPIVCVDEAYIDSQAQLIKAEHYDKLLVAFEPISAIGTGKSMDAAQVEPVVKKIRKVFPGCKVLYGGSTSPDNVSSYLEICDGVLVGGASLQAETFYKMASQVED